jgi:hypothetical protein
MNIALQMLAMSSGGSVTYQSPQEIAQEMTAPTQLTHVFQITDSRLTRKASPLITGTDAIKWGGFSADYFSPLDRSGAHDASNIGNNSGDTTTASAELAGNINAYSPGNPLEVRFIGGAAGSIGSQNALLCRMATTLTTSSANYTNFWTRMAASGESAKLRGLYFKHSGGMSGAPKARLHWHATGSLFTDSGNIQGDYVTDTTGSGYGEMPAAEIPDDYDWDTYTGPGFEVVSENGTASVENEVLVLPTPLWVEAETGIVLHSWGEGGRSVDGFLSTSIFPDALLNDLAPMYGARRWFWIDLGTNNPSANDQAAHVTKITALIERCRASSPGASIILTTSYPASADAGIVPYYVLAAREVADAVDGVCLLDTWEAMPTYADGVTAGFYSDTVHLNDTGTSHYGHVIGQLALAKANAIDLNSVTSSLRFSAEPDQITITGSGVSEWANSATPADSVAQSTDSARPAYVTSWRQTRGAIQGASGDYLQLATFAGGAKAGAATYYIACEWADDSIDLTLFDSGGDATNRQLLQNLTDGSKRRPNMYAGANGNPNVAIPALSPCIIRLVFNGAASSMLIEPHGKSVISFTGISPGTNSLTGLTLLANRIGTGSWGEKLAHFQRIDGVAPAEDGEILTELRARYGIYSL